MMSLRCEVYKVKDMSNIHIWMLRYKVDQFEVEFSTSRTKWRQMMATKWYTYRDLGFHALVKRNGICQED
jgi:hypothetical protein